MLDNLLGKKSDQPTAAMSINMVELPHCHTLPSLGTTFAAAWAHASRRSRTARALGPDSEVPRVQLPRRAVSPRGRAPRRGTVRGIASEEAAHLREGW